ncbi:MAG: hypothetical protein NTZ72_07925 [Afipia sp.]|jgi:hypothetical protein|nr:hypothetical protein [Afipia sp.]
MNTKLSISLIAMIAAIPAVAFAQASPTSATPSAETAPSNTARGSQNCAPTQAVPNDGTIAPRGNSTTGQATEPLGDKLAKSDGVLCPPADVDPQMHTPAPNVGKMPVIPPPGSHGGDPSIRPK